MGRGGMFSGLKMSGLKRSICGLEECWKGGDRWQDPGRNGKTEMTKE